MWVLADHHPNAASRVQGRNCLSPAREGVLHTDHITGYSRYPWSNPIDRIDGKMQTAISDWVKISGTGIWAKMMDHLPTVIRPGSTGIVGLCKAKN